MRTRGVPRPRGGGIGPFRRAVIAVGAILAPLLSVLAAPPVAAQERPALSLPVACTLGEDCWVQNLLDTDPGPGARDFRCTAFTYDGHGGTDFRIANARRMADGVAVLAAAPGRVLRVRDGEPDRTFDGGPDDLPDDRPELAGRECGNGIVMEHAGGLVTQYCHLRRGSIAVSPGDVVDRGAPIALVGGSGRTAFTHVHLGVRVDGETVDPFTGRAPGEAAGCGEMEGALWRDPDPIAAAIEAQVVNGGFATGRVSMEAIETGAVPIDGLTRDDPAVVFFGRAANLREGDRQRIVLEGPGVSIDRTFDPLPRKRAQSMVFAGAPAPDGGLAPGLYAGRYEVLRDGELLDRHATSLVVE